MLLFSNEYNKQLGTDEEIIQQFKDCMGCDESEMEPDWEREVYPWICETLDYYCDDFFSQLPDIMCILTGYISTWQGRRAGGKVGKLKHLLREAQEDYNTFILNEQNGTIEIKVIHHDGVNCFVVRALTEKGERYYNNHYNKDPRELHTHLLNTKGYTKKIKYWL